MDEKKIEDRPRVMVTWGSLRSESLNGRLARAAAERAALHGAEVTVVNLRDYPMPIYDADLEETSGLPDAVRRLKALMAAHEGLIIASPEYNSSLSPVLKNFIDWTSRPLPGEGPKSSWAGRTALLLAASPGALGGLRGLYHLREILQNIGVTVLPDPFLVAVPAAHEAFDAAGRIVNKRSAAALDAAARRLVEVLR